MAFPSSNAKDTALERERRLPKSEMGQRLFCKERSVSLQEGNQCLSTNRHCLPWGLAGMSLSGQKSGLKALAAWGQPLWWGGKQGAVCDSWAYNVGIVPSLLYICSSKGGGQGRTELGSICQGPGRELCTAHLERKGNIEWGPPISRPDKG